MNTFVLLLNVLTGFSACAPVLCFFQRFLLRRRLSSYAIHTMSRFQSGKISGKIGDCHSLQNNGDLTQHVGWKTQAGRQSNEIMWHKTVYFRSCTRFSRRSAVLSLPAVLLRKVSNVCIWRQRALCSSRGESNSKQFERNCDRFNCISKQILSFAVR